MLIPQLRLRAQAITEPSFHSSEGVVEWLLAIQAQDYLAARWAIGLRMREATEAAIEKTIAERRIVRTWPMRGTLHFVSAADARWLLALLTPRVIARAASRYRQLELDDEVFDRSAALLIGALEGDRQLPRRALYEVLEADGIATGNQRGVHILGRLAQEGMLVISGTEKNQPSFALLEEWLPPGRMLKGEEALAEVTRRYFTSHGPATVHDLAWWSGLTITEVRRGLELVGTELEHEESEGESYYFSPDVTPASEQPSTVHLLPAFDEYLLSYRDRDAVLDPAYKQRINPGNNGMFSPLIVMNGRVVGTWRRSFKRGKVVITTSPFDSFSESDHELIHVVATRYASFLEMPLTYEGDNQSDQ
jgi:hypothetical protein